MRNYTVFTVKHSFPNEQNPVGGNWVFEQVIGIQKLDHNKDEFDEL